MTGEQVAEDDHRALLVFARGAEVGPDIQEGVGAGVGAPAAADLLLEFDHPNVPFGLVVIERDAEVGREPQDIFAVGGEPGEQRSGRAQRGPTAFAGPWGWWIELLALNDQGVITLAEGRQPPGRKLRLPGGLEGLDADVQFDQQFSELGGPGLAGELGDPGQFP